VGRRGAAGVVGRLAAAVAALDAVDAGVAELAALRALFYPDHLVALGLGVVVTVLFAAFYLGVYLRPGPLRNWAKWSRPWSRW
jgi:hypothetical protein